MTESKARKLQDINIQITACKSKISQSQGQIFSSISKAATPRKAVALTPEQNAQSRDSEDGFEKDIVEYIRTMSNLKDNLEQKSFILEVEAEKDRLKVAQLEQKLLLQSKEVEAKLKQNGTLKENVRLLTNKNSELDQALKEKLAHIQKIQADLSSLKQESITLKLENKNIKADNKIVVSHLDRLTKQIQAVGKKDPLEEREMRVIKALYEHTLPGIELKEKARRMEVMGELKNRVMLEDAVDTNGDLKSLLRRQNEELEILKHQNSLLSEQNEQRFINLQNQKQLVKMWEESNQKLNSIIMKMGEKIISLEAANQSLSQSLEQLKNPNDQNYYQQTRIKAGQFYRKRS